MTPQKELNEPWPKPHHLSYFVLPITAASQHDPPARGGEISENRRSESEEEIPGETERLERLAVGNGSVSRQRQWGRSNGSVLSEKHERFNFLVKHAWKHVVAEGESTMPLILFYQSQ